MVWVKHSNGKLSWADLYFSLEVGGELAPWFLQSYQRSKGYICEVWFWATSDFLQVQLVVLVRALPDRFTLCLWAIRPQLPTASRSRPRPAVLPPLPGPTPLLPQPIRAAPAERDAEQQTEWAAGPRAALTARRCRRTGEGGGVLLLPLLRCLPPLSSFPPSLHPILLSLPPLRLGSSVFGAACRTVVSSALCSKRFCFRARKQHLKSGLSVGKARWDCIAAVKAAGLESKKLKMLKTLL